MIGGHMAHRTDGYPSLGDTTRGWSPRGLLHLIGLARGLRRWVIPVRRSRAGSVGEPRSHSSTAAPCEIAARIAALGELERSGSPIANLQCQFPFRHGWAMGVGKPRSEARDRLYSIGH